MDYYQSSCCAKSSRVFAGEWPAFLKLCSAYRPIEHFEFSECPLQ